MLRSSHQRKSRLKEFFINDWVLLFSSTIPYYTQIIKEEMDDDIDWDSLSPNEQQKYKKMRKEVSDPRRDL